MTTKTKNAAQTQKLGEKLAKKIAGGGVVCLFGGLGAGKTTLVQGIARGLGIKKRVVSPTFIVIRRYEIKDKREKIKEKKKEVRKKRYLWHIDLYRLNNIEEIKALGIEELWQDPNNILLIEWPEKAGSILPKKHWEIRLKSISESEREIQHEFKISRL